MWTLVVVLNTLSSVASLAMAGYGLLIFMMSRYFNPLQIDYTGVVIGSVLLASFLLIPTCCVVASSKLALRDRRSAIPVALIPFVLIVLGVFVIRAIPWPSPPAS
jgi:hypothetical protein